MFCNFNEFFQHISYAEDYRLKFSVLCVVQSTYPIQHARQITGGFLDFLRVPAIGALHDAGVQLDAGIRLGFLFRIGGWFSSKKTIRFFIVFLTSMVRK